MAERYLATSCRRQLQQVRAVKAARHAAAIDANQELAYDGRSVAPLPP